MTPARGRRPRLRGRFRPPGDKSLSHRALLIAALAGGSAELFDLNPGEDVESTAAALRALGVVVECSGRRWIVKSEGAGSFRRSRSAIDCGNSGTTMRLLAGVLAGCPFESVLKGDASLSTRPMGRVSRPLERMGAEVRGRDGSGDGETGVYPPLRIAGGGLKSVRWNSPVASAQVKSAVLLAGVVGGVKTTVLEPHRSRDHTERMLRALGARVERVAGGACVRSGGKLEAPHGTVPGDPSAGAFFGAAAAALSASDLTLEGVCLNPTRLGFYRAVTRMGARVERRPAGRWCGEPVGELRIRSGKLRGIRIGGPAIPSLVDELPVLAVLAAGAAKGRTVISGAAELRVKETDRIAAMASGLERLGARVRESPDGLVIEGGRLHGGTVDARGDHRVAMAFRVAGLLADGVVRVRGSGVIRISHPGFDRDLRRLMAGEGRR